MPVCPPTRPAACPQDVAALFFFLSIPLGFFVPLYVGLDHTAEGETAMVFFMLLSNVVAFQWRLAPRVRQLRHRV